MSKASILIKELLEFGYLCDDKDCDSGMCIGENGVNAKTMQLIEEIERLEKENEKLKQENLNTFKIIPYSTIEGMKYDYFHCTGSKK